MNYYAQGGQPHGIKSLAQDLAQYGRGGDTMVAHINPQEAALLKSMGGAGTINPITGLPEFGFFKSITNAVKGVVQPVYNATFKNIPGVDQALVGLDKGVGSLVPGGWGTIASIAGSAAGLPTWALTGLGALTGSGALRGSGKFNLQGALMGGAMAYGMGQLGEAARAADISGYDPSSGLTSAVEQMPGGATSSGDFTAGLSGSSNVSDTAFKAAQSNIDPSALESMSREAVSSAKVLPVTPNAAPGLIDQGIANLKSTGSGIANLTGMGSQGIAGIAPAASAAAAPITTGGLTALATGTMGTMQLAEQEKYLNEQLAQGTVSQTEYNNQMSTINDARRRAEEAVKANPYQFSVGGMALDEASRGGAVDSEMGTDDMSMGGITGYAMGGSIPGYAGGRFLSGGGDGLSDDIPATIGDHQPAKLADGEFVVSSDVVSNLGNGSSKAGAKKLYAMMDRVRQQAHGTKKQIRKVNANKVLPA